MRRGNFRCFPHHLASFLTVSVFACLGNNPPLLSSGTPRWVSFSISSRLHCNFPCSVAFWVPSVTVNCSVRNVAVAYATVHFASKLVTVNRDRRKEKCKFFPGSPNSVGSRMPMPVFSYSLKASGLDSATAKDNLVIRAIRSTSVFPRR